MTRSLWTYDHMKRAMHTFLFPWLDLTWCNLLRKKESWSWRRKSTPEKAIRPRKTVVIAAHLSCFIPLLHCNQWLQNECSTYYATGQANLGVFFKGPATSVQSEYLTCKAVKRGRILINRMEQVTDISIHASCCQAQQFSGYQNNRHELFPYRVACLTRERK